METGIGFKGVRVVGGHLALDFVNTQAGPHDGPPDIDALGAYEDLLGWSRQVGGMGQPQGDALAALAQQHQAGAASSLRAAKRTRDYLREIFSAMGRGLSPSPSQLDQLRQDAARSLHDAQLVEKSDGFDWDWGQCVDLRAPLWPIVHSAAELLRAGPLTRIRQCDGCLFLFIDMSKNGSRRWCSMEDCGQTAKMRRYVAKRSAGRAPDH